MRVNLKISQLKCLNFLPKRINVGNFLQCTVQCIFFCNVSKTQCMNKPYSFNGISSSSCEETPSGITHFLFYPFLRIKLILGGIRCNLIAVSTLFNINQVWSVDKFYFTRNQTYFYFFLRQETIKTLFFCVKYGFITEIPGKTLKR